MPLSTSVIVVIMCRGDLHASSSELSIDHLIAYDHHLPLRNEGVRYLLSNEVLVARILGVNSNRAITEHGL